MAILVLSWLSRESVGRGAERHAQATFTVTLAERVL
jgi:hypothetical protein